MQKNNKRENFCIACTSTLELGIDIGTVDEVVQIDSAHSIASLIQRVGRSGRKENMTSQLFLYATNNWSLLQSISCWLLYKEGFIEPIKPNLKPFDILLHQILSIVKSHSGVTLPTLNESIQNNFKHFSSNFFVYINPAATIKLRLFPINSWNDINFFRFKINISNFPNLCS